MGSKLRKYDETAEGIVCKFLDDKFYNRVELFDRKNDINNQVDGIDTTFEFKGTSFLCDEKAAIRYVNKKLNTFAFELSFINKAGNRQEGWFLDNNKRTNSYLLCYINRAQYDSISSVEDILEAEVILVTRDKLIKFLDAKGWSKKLIKLKCDRIIHKEDRKFGDIYIDGVKFSYSDHLYEQPVNILISRYNLRKISEFNVVIHNV